MPLIICMLPNLSLYILISLNWKTGEPSATKNKNIFFSVAIKIHIIIICIMNLIINGDTLSVIIFIKIEFIIQVANLVLCSQSPVLESSEVINNRKDLEQSSGLACINGLGSNLSVLTSLLLLVWNFFVIVTNSFLILFAVVSMSPSCC